MTNHTHLCPICRGLEEQHWEANHHGFVCPIRWLRWIYRNGR